MIPLLFLVGLALVTAGAEALVRGSSRLAGALGVSPLVVGLTVVAFGTSSPEFAVSLRAALAGQPDIALGNVVGSNIFNILFILGLSSLAAPLVVAQRLVHLDVPLMVGVSALSLILALDGSVGRADGVLLFAGLVAYVLFLVRQSGREREEIRDEYARRLGAPPQNRSGAWITNGIWIAGGLAALVLGSHWLVESAVGIARYFGVSDLVIGLTIIAGGTSLPELVTSVVASLRGERDIAVGNVVGSNLFNLMGVLGLSAALAPQGIAVSASALGFDLPIMIAVAFACLPIFFAGHRIGRWEGVLLFGYYLAYTAYLILSATGHAALPMFAAAMLYFVLPISGLTLGVLSWRAWRARRGGLGRVV